MTVVKVKCAVRSGHTLTAECAAVPQTVRGMLTHGAVKLRRTGKWLTKKEEEKRCALRLRVAPVEKLLYSAKGHAA